jgi:hypothetical protein
VISLPEGFNFTLLISDYFEFVKPFIIPALIASTFVLIVGVLNKAKRV